MSNIYRMSGVLLSAVAGSFRLQVCACLFESSTKCGIIIDDEWM